MLNFLNFAVCDIFGWRVMPVQGRQRASNPFNLRVFGIVAVILTGLVCTYATTYAQVASQDEAAERQEFTAWVAAGSRALQDGDDRSAEKWFRKALSLDPHSVEILNNLAISIARQGREEEAISLYQQALQLRRSDPVTRRNLGAAYFRARQYQKALPYLRDFAETTPTFQSLDLAGLDLFALDQYSEAAVYLDRASRLQPDDLPTLDILGKAYWRAKNYSGVTKVFDRIMAVNPNSPEAHFMMGLAYDIEYREQDARKEFLAVLAADPNYPDIHSSLGLIAWRQHDVAQAEDQFQQQLDHTPTDPISNYMMGLILQQKDQPAQALPYLKAAVAVNPSYKDALLALGQCYLTLKEPEEALKPLTRATTVDPEFNQAHFVLSRVYARLGRTADARREENICRQLQARQHDSAAK